MRTLIIIICIIAVILVSNAFSARFYENELEYYTTHLEKAFEAVDKGDTEFAEQTIEAVHAHWDERMNLWGVLSDHLELEAIDILLHKAEKYPRPGYEEEVQQDLIEIMRLIDYVASRYKFEVQNIF